jgi:hypothetical protein
MKVPQPGQRWLPGVLVSQLLRCHTVIARLRPEP